MASIGLDRRTGRVLTDWPHVVQSIEDIVTTAIQSRIMRRAYGSDTLKLIDAPMNRASLLAWYVAIAESLEAWEPRYELRRVNYAAASADGQATLDLVGIYYPNGHKGDRTPDNGRELAVSLVLLNETNWRAA
jgi:phage baseplate assembly protein W